MTVKKIIFISHILTATDRLEHNDKKSLIFGIRAKFWMSQMSSQMLKIAKNGISMYLIILKLDRIRSW